MTEIKHPIEEWIEMRATLQRQRAGIWGPRTGANISDSEREATIARIEEWIDELNSLLKEFSRSHAL